jgi:hypothetical protein
MIELFELGEFYLGGSSVSSSSRSSMRNNLLHTSWLSGMKRSLHLKHRPFSQQSVISAGENFVLIDARPEGSWLMEPVEVAAEVGAVHGLDVA